MAPEPLTEVVKVRLSERHRAELARQAQLRGTTPGQLARLAIAEELARGLEAERRSSRAR